MFADTEAIRIFGSANSAQVADLAVAAAALSSMPGTAAATLGPVGAGFVAAFANATKETSRAVTVLADRLAAGCHTAHASAAAYEGADERTGALVSWTQ